MSVPAHRHEGSLQAAWSQGLAGPGEERFEWTPESVGTATAAASTTVKTKATESIFLTFAFD